MTYCPWCQTYHEGDHFCEDCGYCENLCDCGGEDED